MTAKRLIARAELVLDPRLVDVWRLVWDGGCPSDVRGSDPVSEATIGALLRLAYLLGYTDAKDEPEDGALLGELGVRRKATTAARRRRGGRPTSRNSGR